MKSILIKQLQGLRQGQSEPAPEWLKNSRQLLLTQVKNTIDKDTEPANRLANFWSWLAIFLPQGLVFNVVRPLAVLVVVALVGTSGWIASVDAAYDALPGDGVAYYLKRGLEKTQVAVISLVGDSDDEAKLHLKFASSRANEVKKMLAGHDKKKARHVAQTVQDLKQEITTVNTKIEKSSSAETIKDVAVDAKEIKNLLQDAKNLLSASTTPDLAQQVKDVKDLAKDTSVKAMETLVNKVVSGDQTVTTEEVKQVLGKALQSAATEAMESQVAAESLKVAVDSVKNGIIGATTTPDNTSSTIQEVKDFAKMVAVASTQTNIVVEQTIQVSSDVTSQVTEAQKAILNGDLATAVGTIKDVAQITKTVEQLTDTVVQQAQSVLPVASVDVNNVIVDSAFAVSSSTAFPSATATSVPQISSTAN
ncbi:MAG: DUF5667 domain-containing protein [Candidatus Magasanikbacteria bacterium]|nr:DUF5667 domain-containing protein [Candidatus Magasanikbacteria bacterium]